MTGPGRHTVQPDDGEIAGIAADVWRAFTDLAVAPGRTPQPPTGDDLAVGTVRVEGAWRGSVTMACPQSLARRAAAAMLAAPADSLGEADVADALGELTNMVGGNVKSLLPAPSTLSLPTVALAGSMLPPATGDELTNRVGLLCEGAPVIVSLWRSAPDG